MNASTIMDLSVDFFYSTLSVAFLLLHRRDQYFFHKTILERQKIRQHSSKQLQSNWYNIEISFDHIIGNCLDCHICNSTPSMLYRWSNRIKSVPVSMRKDLSASVQGPEQMIYRFSIQPYKVDKKIICSHVLIKLKFSAYLKFSNILLIRAVPPNILINIEITVNK